MCGLIDVFPFFPKKRPKTCFRIRKWHSLWGFSLRCLSELPLQSLFEDMADSVGAACRLAPIGLCIVSVAFFGGECNLVTCA